VLNIRLARSLYCPGGHLNFLKLPDRPIVGQASDASDGQGWQEASHGSPKRRQDVKMEIAQASKIL